jgi:hypothetical protein
VRDASAEDGEDCGRALAAEIAMGKEPVLPAEHQRPQLSLDTIVRKLNPTVTQEQDESMPLAVKIAKRLTE